MLCASTSSQIAKPESLSPSEIPKLASFMMEGERIPSCGTGTNPFSELTKASISRICTSEKGI